MNDYDDRYVIYLTEFNEFAEKFIKRGKILLETIEECTLTEQVGFISGHVDADAHMKFNISTGHHQVQLNEAESSIIALCFSSASMLCQMVIHLNIIRLTV